jgi:hypothetical protein
MTQILIISQFDTFFHVKVELSKKKISSEKIF